MSALNIPPVFRRFEDGEPFSNCLICDKELLESNSQYLVERAIKGNDVIYEFAICTDCAAKMQESLSEDSKEAMENFFRERVDMEARIRRQMNEKERDPDEYLGNCVVHGTPVSELERYHVTGVFQGGQMVYAGYPLLLGEEAMMEMAELLSEKTKGWMDDFRGQYLGGPPELADIFKRGPVLII